MSSTDSIMKALHDMVRRQKSNTLSRINQTNAEIDQVDDEVSTIQSLILGQGELGIVDAFSHITDNSIFITSNADNYEAGAENTIVAGHSSGNSAMTGDNNSFIGYQSGLNVSTAAKSILIGSRAGDTLTTGSDNLLMGYRAGHYNSGTPVSTPLQGARNLVIGNEAGITASGNDASRDASDNIMIGHQARMNTEGGNYNLIIGSGSNIRSGNNNLIIGPSITETSEVDGKFVVSTGLGEIFNGTYDGSTASLTIRGNVTFENNPDFYSGQILNQSLSRTFTTDGEWHELSLTGATPNDSNRLSVASAALGTMKVSFYVNTATHSAVHSMELTVEKTGAGIFIRGAQSKLIKYRTSTEFDVRTSVSGTDKLIFEVKTNDGSESATAQANTVFTNMSTA